MTLKSFAITYFYRIITTVIITLIIITTIIIITNK